MKNKLRVSFSLLSLWEQGEIDRAVAMYLRKDYPKTEAMKQGLEWDEKDGESIEKTKKALKEFGEWEFNNPKVQLKLEADYNDLAIVKAVLDTYDEPDIIERKTGGRSASSYLSSKQLPMQYLLCQMNDLPVEKIKVVSWNQHEGKFEWAFMWAYPSLADEARNYIDSLVPEIYEFMDKNNYL